MSGGVVVSGYRDIENPRVLNSKEKYSKRLFHLLVFVLRFIFSET